jgi:hypothetical protein
LDIEDGGKKLCRKTNYLLNDKTSGARRLHSLSMKLFWVPNMFILRSFLSIRTPFQKDFYVLFGGGSSKFFFS